MGSHNDDNEPRVASSRRSFDFAVRPLLRQVPERLERPLPERTFPERLLVSCFPFFRPVIHSADPVPSLEAADDVSVRLADANHALHDNENDEDGNNGDARGGSYARSLLPRVIGSLCRCLPWHWTGNENHGVARRLGEAATLGSNQIARRLGKASDKQAGGDEDGETATGETEEEVRREGQNEAKGKGVKEVKREGEKEVREEGEEEEPPVYLRFENQTQAAVDVLWLSHTGEEHCYFTLQPACCNTQATFEGNVWLVRDAATQKLLHHRVKVALRSSVGRRQRYLIRPRPSQQHILVGTANAAVAAASGTATADGGTTTAGAASIGAGSSSKRVVMEEEAEGDVRVPSCYRQVVGTAVGVPVVAHGRVCMPALCAAADIVEHMLQLTPPAIITRLQDNWCKVAVIGREQVTTDILEHSHLRGTRTDDGRDWDCEVRGLGGTLVIPTCSVGEENLLRCPKDRYREESILVHEFAHTVMEVGFDESLMHRISQCFQRSKHLYPSTAYMVANKEEYWAEGSQSWFNASVRVDVNGGVNNRERLIEHDAELAQLLQEVYGDGDWRYDFTPINVPLPSTKDTRLPKL